MCNPYQLVSRTRILKLFVLALSVFLPGHVVAQQITRVTPLGIPLRVFVPSKQADASPVLIFLHGASACGKTDAAFASKDYVVPPSLIARNSWRKDLPFIVVSPVLRCSANVPHAWSVASIHEVVNFVKQQYRVDASRIYLTGDGIGGDACWSYAAAYPDMVAAIVPVSSRPLALKKCALKEIPVWAFGSIRDVDDGSRVANIIREASQCRGRFRQRFSPLHGEPAESRAAVYAGDSGVDIYTWLLRFRKGSSWNVAPYVNAGDNLRIASVETVHTLSADVFDWDGQVTAVNWSQISGKPVLFSSRHATTTDIQGLKTGTYEFKVTVTDDKGLSASDKVTLEVSSSNGARISSLTLLNGKTNNEIRFARAGVVVDRTDLGVDEFNIRANTGGVVRSVRFMVDGQTVRIVNGPVFLMKKQTSSPEWVPSTGTCLVCAIPYALPNAQGAPADALCARIVFSHSKTLPGAGTVPAIRAIDDIIVSNLPSGNQWVCDGKDIPGATGQIFKPSRPGQYYVRHSLQRAGGVSNLVNFGGASSPLTKAVVQVFPNMAKQTLLVKASSLPVRSSYRIMRGDMTVQQGELFQDMTIALDKNLTAGEYVLVVNGRKKDDGVKFRIR